MKSIVFRNSNLFLRNEFETSGEWGFPIIKKQLIPLDNLDLISYSDISRHDTGNLNKGVHFFIDDYRFESLYLKPDRTLEHLKNYCFVLAPDYSLYSEMNPWIQINSIGKSRWVGANWQHQGLSVIPTISWSTPSSFPYCFDAIEKHSIVAIGMIGCKHSRIAFMRGYNAMLNKIEPEAIICFGKPFPEMHGRLIVVDYISSRKVKRNGR